MSKKFIEGTELVKEGYANGVSSQLAAKGKMGVLSTAEKEEIIKMK